MPIRYGHIVTPVYLEPSVGDLQHIGSGILVESTEGHWLFTAAHVVSEHENGTLLLPGHPDFFCPSGDIASTCPLVCHMAYKDPGDMAYIRLNQEEAERIKKAGSHFLQASKSTFPVGLELSSATRGSAMGYPVGSVTIKERQANVHLTTLGPFPFASDDRIRRAGYDPNLTVGLEYPRKLFRDGQRLREFSPKGMSGGAIWGYFKPGPMLVGIATEFRPERSLLIGSRIHSLIKDLASRIRRGESSD